MFGIEPRLTRKGKRGEAEKFRNANTNVCIAEQQAPHEPMIIIEPDGRWDGNPVRCRIRLSPIFNKLLT
ncbi:hypothetical protein [Amycolatopsis viridis]|uniref:Uncharacterized protein n=1 Tax=Amycolatopsis viridis TaxID=185678 RepID=A0ABX0SU96_9PSEU|nr:hypothetical protein [Amycolatopsis viridis]NIH80220.1 hypothetical protein [Amycolatopsis viridis]